MMFIAGFCMGIAALWIFLELIAIAAKHKTPPPTMHRRKNRDRLRLVSNGSVKEAEAGGIRYEHLGMTGEER